MRLISPRQVHLCACLTSLGRIAHRSGAPFATLPSTPKLAANISRSLGGNMSEVDGATLIARSLKQQGIDHLFGVVGFPITAIAAAAQKEGVAYIGMRNEQSAAYAAAGLRLSDRPSRRLPSSSPAPAWCTVSPGLANAQQNCWPMILIGGASETYRGGMGAFQEERQVLIASPFCKFAHGIESVAAHPLLCRDGDPATRSTAAPAPPISTCPTTSSAAHASSTRSPRPSACPKPPRMVAPAENVEAALEPARKGPAAARSRSARAWRGRAPRTKSAPSSSARRCRSCARRWARA